ncbi:hypothetical protein P9265_20705, partial [Schinkia azotoformans]|uniref:hypothetical protein n=1 Tax=Schinkia azotoformans TaxID=1454 RepID=UPI002E1CFE8F|nr:hypothetical protein [Schinkia azotoformans]
HLLQTTPHGVALDKASQARSVSLGMDFHHLGFNSLSSNQSFHRNDVSVQQRKRRVSTKLTLHATARRTKRAVF